MLACFDERAVTLSLTHKNLLAALARQRDVDGGGQEGQAGVCVQHRSAQGPVWHVGATRARAVSVLEPRRRLQRCVAATRALTLVTCARACCTGGDGDHSHDLLWHEVRKNETVVCMACGQHFKLQEVRVIRVCWAPRVKHACAQVHNEHWSDGFDRPLPDNLKHLGEPKPISDVVRI